MTRNLLRLAALAVVLSTTLVLTLPRPALAATSCGTGDHFVSCTKKCCGPGVITTYFRQGVGHDCVGAKSACSGCFPTTCPAGQSPCGTTFGNCAF